MGDAAHSVGRVHGRDGHMGVPVQAGLYYQDADMSSHGLGPDDNARHQLADDQDQGGIGRV